VTLTPEKTDHAELGASTSFRWMACPGSVRLSRGRPNLETEYSRTGTTAHNVAAMALTRHVHPDMWLDLEVEGVKVDEAMVEAVGIYVNYCREIIERVGEGNYWIEKKISLEALNPPGKMFGTSDFIGYDSKECLLDVVDYKNGWTVVEVADNPQLRYYGIGAALTIAEDWPIDKVRLTIVQPNAPHPDGVIRSEMLDYLDLLAFGGELLRAAQKTTDPNAPLVPGPQCRFCPANAVCPAQREHVQALAQVAFEAMPLDVPPAPEALPTEMFVHILEQFPTLEHWMKAFYVERDRRFLAGELPGFKAVAKRANRRWVDESRVEKWLWDDKGMRPEEVYTQKLKSPAQIEKLVGKKNLPEEFTKKESTGYIIVKDSDPRSAITLHAGDAFAALPAGDTSDA
jgi:hypothetical protein